MTATLSASELDAYGYSGTTPAPAWQLLVAETRTGRVTGRLPMAGLQWSHSLQWGGSPSDFRALVALDGPPGTDDRSITRLIKAITAGPWRFMLVACYGTQAVAFGYVGPPRPGPSGTVEIGCFDLPALLAKRLVIATGQRGNLNTPAADTNLGPTTLSNIARLLLLQATSEYGQELPLDLPTVPTVGAHVRNYLATDCASYTQRLQQLSLVEEGPDIIITPVLSADQTAVRLRVDIGRPYLGQTGAPWAWNWPGNCVDITPDSDPSGMGDGIFVPGNGVDKDRPIGASLGTTLVDAGFPLMDVVVSGYGSEPNITVLRSAAAAAGAVARTGSETWKLTVRADASPTLTEWRRGDTFTVRTSRHYWLNTGTATRRIVAVTGDHTDLVTIDTAPVPAAL